MSGILVFVVFYMACLAREGETLPRAPDHCSSLRAALHLHRAWICERLSLTAWCAQKLQTHSSSLLAPVCATRCDSSKASWAQAQALGQLNSPNHEVALCNNWCNGAWFSLHLHQACTCRAAQTFTELYLIYPSVIRKHLSAVSFEFSRFPWRSTMRKGASAT